MRLRQLRQEFPGKFNLVHRSFVLRPQFNPTATFAEYQVQGRKRAGEMTGLPYAVPKVGDPYPSSSLPALTAAKWVELHHPELFDDFDQLLFSAFFENSLNISDPLILNALAEQCKVPDPNMERVINDQEVLDLVMREYMGAQQLGITGIPAVVIGSQIITGAVSLDEYRRIAQSVLT